jgi:hypothetical protein
MRRTDYEQLAQAVDEAVRAANTALRRCDGGQEAPTTERDTLSQACRHLTQANDLVVELSPD